MCTDEGISGVMTKNRDGFNRMVADALSGKIEMNHNNNSKITLRWLSQISIASKWLVGGLVVVQSLLSLSSICYASSVPPRPSGRLWFAAA